tara:strand:- start:667 stop:1074 length:408 start_codon:yes stop_codon:yes gene_type:complete
VGKDDALAEMGVGGVVLHVVQERGKIVEHLSTDALRVGDEDGPSAGEFATPTMTSFQHVGSDAHTDEGTSLPPMSESSWVNATTDRECSFKQDSGNGDDEDLPPEEIVSVRAEGDGKRERERERRTSRRLANHER